MSDMTPLLKRLFDETSYDYFVEYVLIAILVALAALIAVHGLGNVLSSEFNFIGDSL